MFPFFSLVGSLPCCIAGLPAIRQYGSVVIFANSVCEVWTFSRIFFGRQPLRSHANADRHTERLSGSFLELI
jgi:hypothetical protein